MNTIARILVNFRLKHEKEDYIKVTQTIREGIIFRGTNLWVLVFAIFIASLGLNVNSTAVIIGAMLISPLMGPIMGLGLGTATADFEMLHKSFRNYAFATGVSLVTSTLYFSLSPLNEAHSEILARTSPNIYDVLIAFFGGLAGMVAVSSKKKGNIIPGVAIATALMPPLCTAGYGIASLSPRIFLGAIYLFLINTVFIATATHIAARLLHFPKLLATYTSAQKRSNQILIVLVILTLAPSMYFGYDSIQQVRFSQRANQFIAASANFPNNYLLSKSIDYKSRTITLIYGGETIDQSSIDSMTNLLKIHNLENTKLKVQQGFSYLSKPQDNDQSFSETNAKDREILALQYKLDSLIAQKNLGKSIYKELKTLYPGIAAFSLHPTTILYDSTSTNIWITTYKLKAGELNDETDSLRLVNWLKMRIPADSVMAVSIK